MPKTIPRETVIRGQLEDTVNHAIRLNQLLEHLIAVKPRQPSGGFHGKIDFSQPPWYAPVANAITDLHALAREAEENIRYAVRLPHRPRGSSDRNTALALGSLITHSQQLDDFTVRRYTRELEKWARTAKTALAITELPKRLPRIPGQPEPRCPFCSRHTLRSSPLDGQIWCIDKTCTDGNGNRPRARMEFSRMHNGELVMVWQDGISGVPA